MAGEGRTTPPDGWWGVDEVAAYLDLGVRTVHRMTWASTTKVRQRQLLTPLDLPLPKHMGSNPYWRPEWIEDFAVKREQYRRDNPKRPLPRTYQAQVMPASKVEADDVLIDARETTPWIVLDVRRELGGRTSLLITRRRRDPGHWVRYDYGAKVNIYRR